MIVIAVTIKRFETVQQGGFYCHPSGEEANQGQVRELATAAEKKVYEAVYERSLLTSDDGMDYPACECVDENDNRCKHNGTKYRLEMAHIIPKSQGGPTSLDNVKNYCFKCHRTIYHGIKVVG